MSGEDRRRIELIRRLCEVPAEALSAVERLLERSTPPVETEIVASATSAPVTSARNWPHAPLHRLSEHGTYIVTAGTLQKEHLFRGPERLDLLETQLLALARQHGLHLEAWAVFSNHYHFVGHSTETGEQVRQLLSHLHTTTASELNTRDGTPRRTVWHNFWDTQLTFEKSYLARLNYVHQNPVKHGLVPVANQYPWCSAAWFERTAAPSQVKTIYSFKTDKLRVLDEYEPI